MGNFVELWMNEAPETFEAFKNFSYALMNSLSFDDKTFHLIYIALQSSKDAAEQVSIHAAAARQAGATRNEVKSAVLLTLMATGNAGIVHCLEAALNGYDGSAEA